jgi:hypothetical protein
MPCQSVAPQYFLGRRLGASMRPADAVKKNLRPLTLCGHQFSFLHRRGVEALAIPRLALQHQTGSVPNRGRRRSSGRSRPVVMVYSDPECPLDETHLPDYVVFASLPTKALGTRFIRCIPRCQPIDWDSASNCRRVDFPCGVLLRVPKGHEGQSARRLTNPLPWRYLSRSALLNSWRSNARS